MLSTARAFLNHDDFHPEERICILGGSAPKSGRQPCTSPQLRPELPCVLHGPLARLSGEGRKSLSLDPHLPTTLPPLPSPIQRTLPTQLVLLQS